MTQSTTPSANHALVFGASGLAGWAVVDQLLDNYPAEGTFSKVTALVNRPLSLASSHWPSPSPSRPSLDLVSGVNLLADGTIEELSETLKEKVQDIANVTHAFYFAYKPEPGPLAEVKVNCKMLERAVGMLNHLSPELKFVAFPSGTKGYGIHILGGVFKAPYKESLGQLPEPAANEVWYNAFREILDEQSKGKGWAWCEVRPDIIVGFVPNGSANSLAAHWANYLSTYALVEGRGAKVPFPGTETAYTVLFNDGSADIIARLSIWASFHPEQTQRQLFNIADQGAPSSMSERWPALANYFGLEGTGPIHDPNLLKPGEYIKKHKGILEKYGAKGNEVFHTDFLDAYGYHFTFDRHLSLDKARLAGFLEEVDPNSSWFKAFDRFKQAGVIFGEPT